MQRSLILALCLAPALGQALEFKPSARLNGQASYSSVNPRSSWGADGESFLVPALKQGDWMLLPLVGVLGRTSARSLEEESFFVESYTFLAKPQLLWKRGEAQYKLLGGAKRVINKETVDEVWSKGKYDYEEFSAGLGGQWKGLCPSLGKSGASLEVLHRSYMNWHELGTLVVGGKNYYDKDYNGLKLVLDTESAKDAKHPWTAGYTFLLKNYTDAYLDSKKNKPDVPSGLRQDQLHRLETSCLHALSPQWGGALNLGLDLNLSNMSYLDPGTTDYDADFYSYHSETLGGSLTWFPRGEEGPTLSPHYSLTSRNYLGRSIRKPDGDYTQGKQADIEHRLGLDGRWPLVKWAALTAGVDYYSVQSNQAYVARINNTFDVFKASLGADLRY